jgi:site-specific recombinase XerD
MEDMNPGVDDPSQIIVPRQAREKFLNSKKGEVKESSRRAYEFPTKHFVEFCEKHDVSPIGEVNEYVLESWKENRKDDDVKLITVNNNCRMVRVFIRWCENSGLVDPGLADRMDIPDLKENQAVSDETLPLQRAEQTLRHLSTYNYASRQHALFKLMWESGARASGMIALDLCDFEPQSDGKAILKFRNRPSQGTALKNSAKSERNITITEDTVTVLNNYIEGRRHDVTDEYGREPLFTTAQQRVTRQRIYKNVVAFTRPCVANGTCPHDRVIDDCAEAQSKAKAPGCPSSQSTHPVRRGSITYHLNRGWPKQKLSERVDVSVKVLDKHYNQQTEEDERAGRKEYLDLL